MWYFGWLFLVLVILLVAIVMYITFCDDYGDHIPLGATSFVSLAIVVVLWIVMVAWAADGPSHRMDVYDETANISDTIVIKSAALNSEIDGSFFLGIGNIDQEDVYKFYQVDDSVTYSLKSLPVKTTRIREIEADSSFVPHIISYYYTKGTQYHNWLYRSMVNKPKVEHFENFKQLKEHIIYVPKGTIIGDLSKLNLK